MLSLGASPPTPSLGIAAGRRDLSTSCLWSEVRSVPDPCSNSGRRRSPNGSAVPYYDKSKHRWYTVVRVDSHSKKVSGATRDEASARAEEVRRDLLAGKAIGPDSRRTVGHLLDVYITEVAPLRNKSSTLDTYQRAVELYIKPALGHVRLTALDFEDVERMQQQMVQAGKARSTVLQARKVLSIALKWAVKKRWVAASAVTYADLPIGARPAKETRHLTGEEFSLLREAIAGDRMECAYLLGCYLGLRRGEILGLVWSDIDFEQKRITISRQLRRVRERPVKGSPWKLMLTTPKTTASTRTLPLPQCAIDALLRHRNLQTAERENGQSGAGSHPRESWSLRASAGMAQREGRSMTWTCSVVAFSSTLKTRASVISPHTDYATRASRSSMRLAST